jgi:hypothetical protein
VKRLLVFSLVVAMLCFGGLFAFGLRESPPAVNSVEMIAMNPTAQIPVTVEKIVPVVADAPPEAIITYNDYESVSRKANYISLGVAPVGYPLLL